MTSPSPALDSATLLSALKWRYATKEFDPSKKIPAETWQALEESLVLTPSSFGLQPWKFLVIGNPEMRAKLRPHANGQAQVTDASHFVVFAIRKNMDIEHIERYIRRVEQVRTMPGEALKKYRDHMVDGMIYSHRSLTVNTWASNQTFIALGQFMLAAALMKIDVCPMEGFDKAAFDEVLGIGKRGLSAVVCGAAGYRSESDKYAHLAKVRFEAKDVLEHV